MSMNLPFEPSEPFELTEAVQLSGGVVVATALVAGHPALMFRFARADGTGFYQPTVLVCSPDDLSGLVDLVRDAVAHLTGGAS